MQSEPDDILWITEARMLSLCKLARSTFQSWVKAGLDIEDEGGAYGLSKVLAVALLVEARRHLGLEELLGAWWELARSDDLSAILGAARRLEKGERFDLVIEPEHASIALARSDVELVAAVRHPGAPRSVVVVDLSDRTLLVKESFFRLASRAPRPEKKRRGRPRRKEAEERRKEAEVVPLRSEG
jgi:hypothetical protein